MQKRYRGIGFAPFAALATAALAQAQLVPAQTFDASAPGTVWLSSFCCDRTVGWQFTLAADRDVTALGVFDRGAPSPDPGMGDLHEVAMWNATGTMLAMAAVPQGTAGTTLNGDFRYVAIQPLTLTGAADYVIGAFWRSAAFDHFPDLEQSGIQPTRHPDVTFVSSEQLFGSFGFPTVGSFANEFLAGTTNFLINDSGAPVPVGTNYCGPAVPNSTGFAGTISGTGFAIAGGLPLNLAAANLPQDEFGIFLASQTQGIVAPPQSQGIRCVVGQVALFNRTGEVRNTASAGAFDLDVNTMDMPGTQAAILAGETWNFQAWHRDRNPSGTSNFTDGLSVTFQ
ncbi:MAG: hypothetical protein GY711_29595 [bacterium]|nr:hypothetical protein [bacterium]